MALMAPDRINHASMALTYQIFNRSLISVSHNCQFARGKSNSTMYSLISQEVGSDDRVVQLVLGAAAVVVVGGGSAVRVEGEEVAERPRPGRRGHHGATEKFEVKIFLQADAMPHIHVYRLSLPFPSLP